MSGDNTKNLNGVYGTKGISSPSNKPGSRDGAISWTDATGNFWLFGGYGFPVSGPKNYLNDLWKFNASTGEWIWVSGDSTINVYGKYGAKGTATATNKPGARYNNKSNNLIDASDNLWVFGGNGYAASGVYDKLNDLWKFNINSGLWTWVSGDSTVNNIGIYGVKGIFSVNSKPSARRNSNVLMDFNGALWLFGGIGNGSGSGLWLNDLWKYNINTNQWAWINGDSIKDQYGVYGTKGISSQTNKPGSRESALTWSDATGNIWLFGGYGNSASLSWGGLGELNDLWKYNINSGQWSWMSCDSIAQSFGIYGTKGIEDVNNKPGSRFSSIGWKDVNGNLWLFGGSGYDANTSDVLNDLWKYNINTGKWTWMKGDNIIGQQGIYGTKGIANANNKPGARTDAISWIDAYGNFRLFGGYGKAENSNIFGELNDLWRLGVDPLPIILSKFSIEKNTTSALIKWSTASEINNKYFEVQRSIDDKEFSAIGIIEAKGFASNYLFKDEKPFVGINYYRLKQIDNDGKYSYSETKSIKFDGDGKFSFTLYPNPTKEKVNFYVSAFSGKGEILITDISGKQMQQQVLVVGNNTIEIKSLTKGIYFVNIVTEKEKQAQKLLVE